MSTPRSMSSRVADMVAGAAAMSGVGYLLAAYSVSRWLTRRARSRPKPPPATAGMTWENAECCTEDGQRLAGWVVTPAHVRGTVAIFHGMRHSRTQTLPRIAYLTQAGYRCVAFDHRAHGQSTGRISSFGYHEGRDVCAVLDFVEQRWPDQPKAALGISMGAAALCFAGRRVSTLDCCILESLYYDVASAFQSRIGSRFPAWFRRFAPGVVWVTERRLGAKLEQVAPADHIGELAPVPVLLIAGGADSHAPPEDVKRLSLRCKSAHEMLEIAGADHFNLLEKGGATYQDRVLAFLARHLVTC